MGFFDNLMSPLNRDHCMLFYYLGLLYLFFAVVAVIGFVMCLFKTNSRQLLFQCFMSFIGSITFYYVFRVNYSICLGALR